MFVCTRSHGLTILLALFLNGAATAQQGNENMLPVDAWKSAPSGTSWDAPKTFLPELKRPALLIIDAEEEIRPYLGSAVVNEMRLLVEAFRNRCLPIVFKLWPIPAFNEEWRRNSTCVPRVPLKEVGPSTESEANRTVKYIEYDQFYKNPHLDHLLDSWDVDSVIIAGGFTEHCIIATANALFSRRINAIIPAAAVGPHNVSDGVHSPTNTPSVQHEAALIAKQSSVAQVVPDSTTILEHLESHGITGSVCPKTPVSAPAADYMKHAFPKEQDGYCNPTLHPSVSTAGIDKDLGAWPIWAPVEAKKAASPPAQDRQQLHV